MKQTLVLIAFFLCGYFCQAQEVKKIYSGPPDTSKAKPRRNVMLFISGDDSISIGTRPIIASQLDSLLGIEINKTRQGLTDTVTVVINADSSATYGRVYYIMRSAKKLGAKVVATVK